MAGDWIKVEHATLDKPEVSIAAHILNVSPNEALGLFIRYWVWLDQNFDDSLHGLVRFVCRKTLEKTMNCAGFAAVLEHIGWADFDDEQQLMTVKNWERHNGKSAKSRALNQRRMATNRAVSVRFENAPEKRREENYKGITSEPVDKSAKEEAFTRMWIEKGLSLGLTAHPGESTRDFADRVRKSRPKP